MKFWECRGQPRRRKSPKPTVNWRANIILTSIKREARRNGSSKLPKRMLFSRTRTNAKSMTRWGQTGMREKTLPRLRVGKNFILSFLVELGEAGQGQEALASGMWGVVLATFLTCCSDRALAVFTHTPPDRSLTHGLLLPRKKRISPLVLKKPIEARQKAWCCRQSSTARMAARGQQRNATTSRFQLASPKAPVSDWRDVGKTPQESQPNRISSYTSTSRRIRCSRLKDTISTSRCRLPRGKLPSERKWLSRPWTGR